MPGTLKTTEMTVGLGKRSYPIVVGPDLMDSVGSLVKSLGMLSPVPIITDDTVAPLYAERVKTSLEKEGFKTDVLTFPAGEPSKNLTTISRLYDEMVALRPERKSGLIALGGGVAGDMAGFVAATYLRGIRFIQIPTTLLAQVDASVGGKVGIDHPGGKNLIGAFHQPSAVLIDPATLKTLDPRQVKAGLAEAIKHGVIADEVLFKTIDDSLGGLLDVDEELYGELIPWNCRIKADVVEQDEREQGVRAILNFGHTIGHAIESLTHYETYLHGEAVAIGMAAEAQLGERLGFTPSNVVNDLCALLDRADFPMQKPELSTDDLIACMFHDKKVEEGQLRFIFPTGMGQVTIESVSALNAIKDVWDSYSFS